MKPLTFIKFGGSVITDKRGQEQPDLATITRLAEELNTFRRAHPDQQFVVGHGSGSFGHHYAAHYHIHQGLGSEDDWTGFALTAGAALRLNRMVCDALLKVGVPALSLQPSATLRSKAGTLVAWQTDTITQALNRGLVPLIHGDVAFDTVQGCAIISTETLFRYLAQHTELHPERIILVGEDAVYTADPRRDENATPIPLITGANIHDVLGYTGASHAVDVTGGMRTKIAMMWDMVQELPGLEITLIGTQPGLLASVLAGEAPSMGTRIRQ